MSPEGQDLVFDTDGTCRFIYSDDLAAVAGALGTPWTMRASHVEPSPGGLWHVDLAPVDGPRFDGFTTRAEALAFEVRWLKDNRGL